MSRIKIAIVCLVIFAVVCSTRCETDTSDQVQVSLNNDATLTNITDSDDHDHDDQDNDGRTDYQDLFKLLNIGIANTLRSVQKSRFYYLAPNMYLVKRNWTDSNREGDNHEEPITGVVSLVQLVKSTDSLFKSHSLFCLLADKTGLQIAKAPGGNEDFGIRIKKLDERLENQIQEGRGRHHELAFLPIMYAMGVIMTMLGVITFLTIKSITIGVILLVVAYTYTLGKLKHLHHKKFYYHYPDHYHNHHPHYHHGHKGYAIDALQHDILHDYEQEFPLSPHAAESAAYHIDVPAYQDAQTAASSPQQDKKAYSQAGWAYVLVDKMPDKTNNFHQKRGVVAKKKRKVSNVMKKVSVG